MTPILPPDKLREILDAHAEYYVRETMKFFQEKGVSPALSKDNEGDTTAYESIQALAADALVAELESIVGWRSDAKEPILIQPEFRHLPLRENVDARHQMLVSERLAQLTTVPDLPSEHETLRELDHE